MSRNGNRWMIAVLAVVTLSLTGMSALQVSADSELVPPESNASLVGFGNFCNNIFIPCGGVLVCPSGCYCSQLGSGSGICLR